MVKEDELMERTISGTNYILFQQIFTRLLTFTCNIYITRISSVVLLGRLQDFELLHATLLFLSRESIRMALLRNSSSTKATEKHQLIVNMSFIPLLAFLGLTLPALVFMSSSSLSYPLMLYVLAAGIELLAEPLFVYCQSRLLYSTRVKVEGFAFIVQCTATLFGCVLSRDKETGLVGEREGTLIYGAAYVLYSICLIIGYLFHVSNHLLLEEKSDLISYFTPRLVLSRKSDKPIYFDAYLVEISASFILQTIIKHILTAGDKIVLFGMGVASEQKGSYKLVSDLGSLVARMIFLPIEETSRAFFAQALTNIRNAKSKLANREKSLQFLVTLVKFHLLFGSLFVFFAPNYTALLLSIIYAKSSIESSSLLALYCGYVPFLGVNGISEAFLQGVGGSDVLHSQMIYMFAFWVAYLGTSYITIVLLNLSSFGLVISNIVNMTLRIWFSFRFIFSFFRKSPSRALVISDFIPGSLGLYICLCLSFFITQESAKSLSMLPHIAVGAVCFSVTFATFYWNERNGLVQDVVEIFRKRK